MAERVALLPLVPLVLVSSLALAGDKEEERLDNCATIMSEILKIPDALPQDLLDRAECLVVLPSVKKVAIGLGGSYGRGALVCRGGKEFTGAWGPPALYALEGGNIGLQLGGQATDFILLVMNTRGADSILKSKVKLGADASAAAGPKGRTATAATDALMSAEILSYSRSKGLFAGVSLEGSTLRQDKDANQALYGRELEARQIVREGAAQVPAAGRRLVDTLQKASPVNRSQ